MNKDEEITHMGEFVNEQRVKTFIKRHFYVIYIDFTSHKGMLANQTAHKKEEIADRYEGCEICMQKK